MKALPRSREDGFGPGEQIRIFWFVELHVPGKRRSGRINGPEFSEQDFLVFRWPGGHRWPPTPGSLNRAETKNGVVATRGRRRGGIGERGRGIILCIKSQRAKYHRTLTRERGRWVGGGREHERWRKPLTRTFDSRPAHSVRERATEGRPLYSLTFSLTHTHTHSLSLSLQLKQTLTQTKHPRRVISTIRCCSHTHTLSPTLWLSRALSLSLFETFFIWRDRRSRGRKSESPIGRQLVRATNHLRDRALIAKFLLDDLFPKKLKIPPKALDSIALISN